MLVLMKIILILLIVFVGGFIEYRVDKRLGLNIPGGTRGIIHTYTYNLVGAAIATAILFFYYV